MNDTLRMLQLCELGILKDIDRICAEHHLTYYLLGGTLLGAIRHSGFIPWDDDVDIGMFREDYQRFQEIMMQEYSEKYFLQNCETDPKYPRIMAKVRLNGTVMQERSYEPVPMCNGVYLDVFPIDRVVRDRGLFMAIRGKIVRLCFGYKTLRAGSDNRHNMALKRLLRFVPKLIPNRLVDRMLSWACTCSNNSKRVAYGSVFLGTYTWKKETHPLEAFGVPKRVRFEGVSLSVPAKPEVILTNNYGDYMKLPPVEKRRTHNLTRLDFGPYEQGLRKELSL